MAFGAFLFGWAFGYVVLFVAYKAKLIDKIKAKFKK